jgi:uncharacterized protein (TIGR02145 family)
MNIAPTYNNDYWNANNIAKHQGVCPDDWHLPFSGEWNELVTFVGGNSVAGSKLKSQTGWNSYSGISSTDEYGFSALPGSSSLISRNVGEGGFWWSATEQYSNAAQILSMYYEVDYVTVGPDNKRDEVSVRCLRY